MPRSDMAEITRMMDNFKAGGDGGEDEGPVETKAEGGIEECICPECGAAHEKGIDTVNPDAEAPMGNEDISLE